MNGALFGIWVIVIGSIITVIILSILAMIRWNTENVVIVDSSQSKCAPAFDTLPDVFNLECCVVGGNLTPNKYFAPLDLVVSPQAVPYAQACAGFCTDGVSTTDPSQCRNGIGQQAYTVCLNELRPVDCLGIAMPIAKSRLTYYYGFSASNQGCQTTQPCQV